MQQRLHHLHSEPSMELFHFINQEMNQDENQQEQLENEQLEEFEPADLEDQHVAQRGLQHYYSHDFDRLQNSVAIQNPVPQEMNTSRPVSNQNMMLHDEICLLTIERLVLIKVHAVLIRHSIDEITKEATEAQT